MKRSDDYPDKFDLEAYGFASLACDVGVEIDSHIIGNKGMLSLIGNPSSKLAEMLRDKMTKLEEIKDDKELALEGQDMVFLKEVLEIHEAKKEKTPYKIKHDLRKLKELKEELVPVVYRISENLKSYKNFSKERQERLRDFSVTLSKKLSGYDSTS